MTEKKLFKRDPEGDSLPPPKNSYQTNLHKKKETPRYLIFQKKGSIRSETKNEKKQREKGKSNGGGFT